jgi:hypothetical protein
VVDWPGPFCPSSCCPCGVTHSVTTGHCATTSGDSPHLLTGQAQDTQQQQQQQ